MSGYGEPKIDGERLTMIDTGLRHGAPANRGYTAIALRKMPDRRRPNSVALDHTNKQLHLAQMNIFCFCRP